MEAALLAGRFLLALLFVLAGASKLRNDRFSRVVASYELLPKALVRPVSVWLPRLEVAAGVLLGLGVAIAVVALLLATLLASFSAVVTLVLLRGREIDCGCFGGGNRSRITWATVSRNLVLASIAAAVALRPPTALSLSPLADPQPSVSSSDALGVLIATSAVVLATLLSKEAIALRRSMERVRGIIGSGTV